MPVTEVTIDNSARPSGIMLTTSSTLTQMADAMRIAFQTNKKLTFPNGFISLLNTDQLYYLKDDQRIEAYSVNLNTILTSYYKNSKNNLAYIYDENISVIYTDYFRSNSTIEQICLPNCVSVLNEESCFYPWLNNDFLAGCTNLRVLSLPKAINQPSFYANGLDIFWALSNIETIHCPSFRYVDIYSSTSYSKLKYLNFGPGAKTLSPTTFPVLETYMQTSDRHFTCSNMTTLKTISASMYSGYMSSWSSGWGNNVIKFKQFASCNNLKSLTIDYSNIKIIESQAFEYCNNISTLSFPSCSVISNYAFYYCQNLVSLSLPNCTFSYKVITYSYISPPGLTSWTARTETIYPPEGVFMDCKNLTTLCIPYFPGKNAESKVIIPSSTFYNCEKLDFTSLYNRLSNCDIIGRQAFYGCKLLSEWRFSKITNVPAFGFQKCGFKTLNVSTITFISDYAFTECSQLSEVNLPNCTGIGDQAFFGCEQLNNFEGVSCTEIGFYAFGRCINLTNINFPNCISIGVMAFERCNKLSSIELPKVETIPNYCFQDCFILSQVNFPECTLLKDYCFAWAYSLNSINFPKLQKVSNNAFYECYNLSIASLGNCSIIGNRAFINCYKLSSIYLYSNSVCQLMSTDAFWFTPFYIEFEGNFKPDVNYLTGSVYVPSELISQYQQDTNWNVLYSYNSQVFQPLPT